MTTIKNGLEVRFSVAKWSMPGKCACVRDGAPIFENGHLVRFFSAHSK